MIRIDFEFQTEHGVFRDCLNLPDDHTFTEAELQAFKEGLRDRWIATITAPPVVEPETRHITVWAFRNRFTKKERIVLELSSLDNPTLSLGDPARQLAAALRVSQKDLETALFVDLGLEDTRVGVQDLENYGLIQAGRATEILDAPVQDRERP